MQIDPIELRKLQLTLLEGLIEIKRVCEKNNIKFFLTAGTLIGAVRHKGFIPWDEDVDIGMTRDNYEKFCSLAPSELPEKYFLQTPFTDPRCFSYGMARVRMEGTKFIDTEEEEKSIHNGFYIDIFPLDNVPASFIKGIYNFYYFNLLVRVFMHKNGQNPWQKKPLKRFILNLGIIFFLPVSKEKIKNILENFHKKYEKANANYIIIMRGRWGFFKERHLKSNISKFTYLPFEGIPMPVPFKYHEYLTEQYGDYMTFPPEKKQIPHHSFYIDFGE